MSADRARKGRRNRPNVPGAEDQEAAGAEGRWPADLSVRASRPYTFAILPSPLPQPVVGDPDTFEHDPENVPLAYRFKDNLSLVLRSSVGHLKLPALRAATAGLAPPAPRYALLTVDHADHRVRWASFEGGALRPGGVRLSASEALPLTARTSAMPGPDGQATPRAEPPTRRARSRVSRDKA